MKKIALIAVLAVLTCCGTAQNKETKQEQIKSEKQMKALVTYFSASGITRNAANQLADIIGADLYEIIPEQPYTEADLDWRDKQSRSTLEMQDKSSRPAVKGEMPNLDQYDLVFVGFPIWWYTAPTIINTFIEANDFSGKTLVPFATSGGSTIKKACEDLKTTYPDIVWKEGRLLNRISKIDIESWVKGL